MFQKEIRILGHEDFKTKMDYNLKSPNPESQIFKNEFNWIIFMFDTSVY